ncbi:MAG TPA: phosphatase PAP2 family protein, partial [Pyrinomonadaceae bacterium]|nr:phosphatase PAP2 family protein [Pyrinomonadaceae bacterium]
MGTRQRFKGYLGWHIVIGLFVFLATTFLLAAISDEVIRGRPLTAMDAEFSAWLQTTRTSIRLDAMRYVTWLGSTVVASIITTVAGIYLLLSRRRYWFAALVLSVAGGAILNRLLKSAFQRARPQLDDPVFTFTGYSFPSGHTLTATVVFGCLAALIVANTKNRMVRVGAILSASLLIALVAFSRIYLGAHYLTDVVGAIAEGLAWLSL